MQSYKDFKLIIDSCLWKLVEIFHIILPFSGLDMKERNEKRYDPRAMNIIWEDY